MHRDGVTRHRGVHFLFSSVLLCGKGEVRNWGYFAVIIRFEARGGLDSSEDLWNMLVSWPFCMVSGEWKIGFVTKTD